MMRSLAAIDVLIELSADWPWRMRTDGRSAAREAPINRRNFLAKYEAVHIRLLRVTVFASQDFHFVK